MRPRRGMTLIELAVVITLQATLLGVAVALIGRLLEADREHRDDVQALSSLHLLAEQFRRDVHLATRAMQGEDSLDLQWPGDLQVRYEFNDARVSRVERREESVVRREVFRLSRNWTVTFEATSSGFQPGVRLVVSDYVWVANLSQEESP